MEESSSTGVRILSIIRQIYACAWVPLTSFLTGIVHKRRTAMNSKYKAAIKNQHILLYLPFLGEVLGALLAGVGLYYIGRKKSLIIINVLMFFCLLMFVNKLEPKHDFVNGVFSYTLSRSYFIVGFVYASEVSTPRLRPFFAALFYLGYRNGLLVSLIWPFNEILIKNVALIFIVSSIVFAFLVPETPYWLATNGEQEAAYELLLWLRGDPPDEVEAEEFNEATEGDAELKQAGIVTNVLSARFAWRLIIIFFMYLASSSPYLLTPQNLNVKFDREDYQFFYGLQKYKYFSRHNLLNYVNRSIGTLLFCGVGLLIGRRVLFLGTIVLAYSLVILQYSMSDDKRLVVYVLSINYVLEYTGGKQIVHLQPCEIFPSVTRDLGVASSELVYLVIDFVERFASDTKKKLWYYNLVISIRWAVIPLGFIFTFFYMPETKNLTLSQAEIAAGEIGSLLESDLLPTSSIEEASDEFAELDESEEIP